METIPIQRPLHILKLPKACSATLPNFLPATKVWNTHLECKHFPESGKHMYYQHHCPTFLHLATYGKKPQWYGSPTSCYPTIHTSTQNIWKPSEQFSMPHAIQHEVIRRFRHLVESIQPPWDIHFSLRISFTSWNCVFLLLLLFGADLPHQCTDLYNQVRSNMQLWMIM